jgi:hypothetical protein
MPEENASPRKETPPGVRLRLLCSWLVVGIPLAWGIWETLQKSLALFGLPPGK